MIVNDSSVAPRVVATSFLAIALAGGAAGCAPADDAGDGRQSTEAALVGGPGLTGDYFAGTNFERRVLTRTDSTVSFDWGHGSPGANVPVDHFSVRWSGTITPASTGTYTFYAAADDGVRLTVAGKLLVDDWHDHSFTERSATIALTAGVAYPIRFEYYENAGRAAVKLSWSSARQSKQVISSSMMSPLVSPSTTTTGPSFPRLMGANIGAKNYDDPAYQAQIASVDVAVLGFYRGWKGDVNGSVIRPTVQKLKALNPKLVVAQYTILNEASDDTKDASGDVATQVNAMDWWARNAAGARVQWTSAFDAWDINFTAWSEPDSNGLRWPEWRAERDHRVFFAPTPELTVQYLDNVMVKPRVTADWNGDGLDDDRNDPAVAAAYRAGHRAEWQRIRALRPGTMLLGNADNDLSSPEYVGQLEGAFVECAIGKSWSIETWGGWTAMMTRYRALMKNTRAPHLVGLNVYGAASDYRLMRYGLTSTMMDDGYFSYTDSAVGYSSVPKFDENALDLGLAIDSPPAAPWQNGVYFRRFQRGAALVNPTTISVTVTVPAGYRRFSGTQAPQINNGQVAGTITLGAKDGIVLVTQ